MYNGDSKNAWIMKFKDKLILLRKDLEIHEQGFHVSFLKPLSTIYRQDSHLEAKEAVSGPQSR